MARTIAKLVITQDDEGVINVEGTGALLQQKAFAYGLLELAKDIIRGGGKPTGGVQPATLGDLPH